MCAANLWVNLQRRYKLRVRHRGHDPRDNPLVSYEYTGKHGCVLHITG